MGKNFEVIIPPTYSYNIFYPIDRSLKRSITVKNTGDETINLRYNVRRISGVGGVFGVQGDYSPLMTLSPGESRLIWLIMDEPQIFGEQLGGKKLVRQENEYLGLKSIEEMVGEYPIDLEVNVYLSDDESKKKTISLNHKFKVISPLELQNTSVRGYVYDNRGKPLNNVQVKLRGRSGIYNPTGKTDKKGFFDISCHTYNIHTYHTYDYQLEVEERGYEFYHKNIEPTLTSSITSKIQLIKTKEDIDYELTKKTRLDMGIYRGAMTKDGKYIAIGVGYWVEGIGYWSKITGRIPESMHVYMFDIDGNMIWKYPMKGEVWGIDISEDGEYVAVCTLSDSEELYKSTRIMGTKGMETLLLDRKGKLIWRAPHTGHPWEIRISPDKKYIAVGESSGHTYLYDIKGNLIWKKHEEGTNHSTQIYFSKDSSKVFVGTQPYLLLYNLNGELIWKSNIGSWPYHTDGMNISEDDDMIVTSGKTGDARLIDGEGNILWAHEMDGHGRWAYLAPDKSFAVIAMVGQEGTIMVDSDGKIHWKKEATDNGMITADSKYILASMRSIMLMNLNGTVLWSYPTDTSTRFCRITKDKSKIVAGDDNGYLYFFKRKK